MKLQDFLNSIEEADVRIAYEDTMLWFTASDGWYLPSFLGNANIKNISIEMVDNIMTNLKETVVIVKLKDE